MKTKLKIFAVLSVILSWFILSDAASGAGYNYEIVSKDVPLLQWKTVIGWTNQHVVADGETLLDIARNYELGWNEIEILYPDVDPWVPEAGTELEIPVLWILPSAEKEGIVINLPELRLYRYISGTGIVETYPVGIGTEEYKTPLGAYKVVDREENPVWSVPPSLREKYSFTSMPAGPNNPLGKYWLGLSVNHIGIHGTNFPWAVGRQVSRGCIRLYPEHIKKLYPEVAVGTSVRIIYEPVKIGVLNGEIYVEVHPDTDGVTTDMERYALERLQNMGNECYITEQKLQKALQEKNGVPVRIGFIQRGGDGEALQAAQKKEVALTEAIN